MLFRNIFCKKVDSYKISWSTYQATINKRIPFRLSTLHSRFRKVKWIHIMILHSTCKYLGWIKRNRTKLQSLRCLRATFHLFTCGGFYQNSTYYNISLEYVELLVNFSHCRWYTLGAFSEDWPNNIVSHTQTLHMLRRWHFHNITIRQINHIS